MLGYDRESVALVIKFLKGGVFLCPCLVWIFCEEQADQN